MALLDLPDPDSGLAVPGFALWFANVGVSVAFPARAAISGVVPIYLGYATFPVLSFWFVRALVCETAAANSRPRGDVGLTIK